MDENNENRDVLRKVLELEQKNYNMLVAMKKSMFWSKVFRYIYWIIIIAISIGAFYYVQPYIDSLLQAYGGFKGNVQSVKSLFQ